MEPTRLAAIPLFDSLDPEHLGALADVASEVVAGEGHALAPEGDVGHALYAIESGTADVSREGETARTLGPGDVSVRSPFSPPAGVPRPSQRQAL